MQAGLDTQATLGGDPAALVSVLDWIFAQLTGVGLFESLGVLKGARYLGLPWYDDVMGHLGQSLKSLDNLGNLHGLLRTATGTGLDASRTAAQRFPGVFDKVKTAFNTADRSVLQSKYDSHAGDFGITGNRNNDTLQQFRDALNQHVQSTETIPGWFRGERAYHHYNPATGLNVMQDLNGNFISGYRLTADQMRRLESTGRIGLE